MCFLCVSNILGKCHVKYCDKHVNGKTCNMGVNNKEMQDFLRLFSTHGSGWVNADTFSCHCSPALFLCFHLISGFCSWFSHSLIMWINLTVRFVLFWTVLPMILNPLLSNWVTHDNDGLQSLLNSRAPVKTRTVSYHSDCQLPQQMYPYPHYSL